MTGQIVRIVRLGVLLGSAAAWAQDQVVLQSGAVTQGRVRDRGRNHIEVETPQGTVPIPKRAIQRVMFGRIEQSQSVDQDRVELRSGGVVAGDVRETPDGKSITVRIPGVGEATYDRKDVVRIIPRGRHLDRPAAGAEELDVLVGRLVARLGQGGMSAGNAERELRELGIFAIEHLQTFAAQAEGDAAARVARVLRAYELRKMMGDRLDTDLPEIYENLESPQAPVRLDALKAAFLVAPDEAVPLAVFVLENPEEADDVRVFCVEVLRGLNRYRELIDAYNRADGALALALALALSTSGIHAGIPAMIAALGEDREGLRVLAGEHLTAATGESFLPAASAPIEEWIVAQEKYRGWWKIHGPAILNATRALVALKPAETPQRARALQYWREGNAHVQAERYANAEKDFRVALDLDPSFARAALSLGILLGMHMKRDVEAAAILERVALGRHPDATAEVFATAMRYLGALHRRGGRFEQAVAWLSKAIEERGDYVDAYGELGETYYQWALSDTGLDARGRAQCMARAEKAYRDGLGAADQYERTLVVMPAGSLPIDDDTGFSRRTYMRSLQTLRGALAETRKALAVNLARVYMAQGDLARAEQHVREAVRTDPENPTLHLLLAMIFERQGTSESKTAAERHYRAVLRLDAGNITASQALRRLERPGR